MGQHSWGSIRLIKTNQSAAVVTKTTKSAAGESHSFDPADPHTPLSP